MHRRIFLNIWPVKKTFLFFLFSIILSKTTLSQEQKALSASMNKVTLEVSLSQNGVPEYAVYFEGKPVILPSRLGFKLNKAITADSGFQIIKTDSLIVDETWKPVWGEVSQIRNHYKQLTVHLQQKNTQHVSDIVFKVYEDGVGFRYEFPEQESFRHFIVLEEHTQFTLAGDHKTFWIPGDHDTNEYLYNTTKLSEINALPAAQKEKDIALTSLIGNNAVQTPLMMKSAEGLYINIHEAALINYPAMNLVLDKKTFTLNSYLVPDAIGNKAYLQTPAKTPWRTIIVSDKATDILASKTILNLNEPSVIGDSTWINPQKFVGMWWEMHVGKATWERAGGKHGANTQNVKKYIDFAAKHGFNGVLVEGWNEGWEDWFGNWKENVFDFVTPYPDYNINELSAYAKAKGVRIIMHHETSGAVTNYERWMDTAYRFIRNQGIETVKTGYVGRIIPRGEHHDGQWMVNHYERVAKKTGEYKLTLIAHESVHPTGLHRTYPNWLANEAARGSEFHNAPTLGMPTEHTTILPFTRLMGRPMDFTPGFFHLRLNQFDSSRKQRVRSTLAKQLALFITMYSPIQMAADLPENYDKHLDAFQFIKDVPVDWDDTKIIEAEPGDYITIARKEKGKNNWFIGAITDENSRLATIPLSFLDKGIKYIATIYADAEDAGWDTNPEAYNIKQYVVTQSSNLKIKLATGGGAAVSIMPATAGKLKLIKSYK